MTRDWRGGTLYWRQEDIRQVEWKEGLDFA